MNILKSSVGRLRIMSILDAISYIYLLYCAIYLKRMLGDDSAIRTPGMIHGVLFTLYCITLLNAMISKRWSLIVTILVGLTSIIPILPFFIDKWLTKQQNTVRIPKNQ